MLGGIDPAALASKLEEAKNPTTSDNEDDEEAKAEASKSRFIILYSFLFCSLL